MPGFKFSFGIKLAAAGLVLSLTGACEGLGDEANSPEMPRFRDVTASAGIEHLYGGATEFVVGGGLAALDCNGDGLPEVVLAGGAHPARLFLNRSLLLLKLHRPVFCKGGRVLGPALAEESDYRKHRCDQGCYPEAGHDGSVVAESPVAVQDADGNDFSIDPNKPSIALCRCGASANKPFCDGAHRTAGFTAADRAQAE